jgi:hypothetical protein
VTRKTLIALFGLLCLASPALADPRPWTFVYDTYPEGKGNLEYEQYVTYSHRTDADHSFSQFQFKHELEYGVTDHLDVSVYAASWNYTDSHERTGTEYEESAVEAICYFSNDPVKSVGVALYTELAFGQHGFDVENKLLIHKDLGKWSLAYNFIVETGFENAYHAAPGEHAQSEGEIGHAFGVSYSFENNWWVGGELTVESIFPRWSDYEDTVVYAGPNAGFVKPLGGGKDFWLTITPMFQVSSVGDEPEFQVRMIAGFVF